MQKLLTLKEMAAKYRRTPKAFSAFVREIGAPFEPFGRSMLFDPVAFSAFLATRREPKPNVIKHNFVRKHKKAGRLAERLEI